MTANDFRKLVLALPETEERKHMNHPDFRVAGKILERFGGTRQGQTENADGTRLE